MFAIPTDPLLILTLVGFVATAILLTMGVMAVVQNPAKRRSFQEAITLYQTGSELDIDTALNKDASKTKRGWYEKWYYLAERAGAVPKSAEAPGNTAIGVAVAMGAIGYLVVLPGNPLAILCGPLLGLVLYRTYLKAQTQKRIKTLERQLPQLLQGLRANLGANATPQQALMSVADDIPAPLGDEMKIFKAQLNSNVPMQIALGELSERVPSREMQFLVSSIDIAIRSGADLDPQLETIQDIVTQRTRIRQKLSAAVAQVKPTKLLALGAMPLMFFVSCRTPENRDYWFGSGIIMLVIAVLIYLAGVYVIRAMVQSVEKT